MLEAATVPSFESVTAVLELSPGLRAVGLKKAVQLALAFESVLVPWSDTPLPVEKQVVAPTVSFRTRVPDANVDPAFVVEALKVAKVPAPNAELARETRSTASRSFLTVDTPTVSVSGAQFHMAAPGRSAWDAINGR
jgi:hypothetical protein